MTLAGAAACWGKALVSQLPPNHPSTRPLHTPFLDTLMELGDVQAVVRPHLGAGAAAHGVVCICNPTYPPTILLHPPPSPPAPLCWHPHGAGCCAGCSRTTLAETAAHGVSVLVPQLPLNHPSTPPLNPGPFPPPVIVTLLDSGWYIGSRKTTLARAAANGRKKTCTPARPPSAPPFQAPLQLYEHRTAVCGVQAAVRPHWLGLLPLLAGLPCFLCRVRSCTACMWARGRLC